MKAKIDVSDLRCRAAEVGDRGTLSGVAKWLALKAGVTHNTMSNYLVGRRIPDPETLRKMAEALGLHEVDASKQLANANDDEGVVLSPLQTWLRSVSACWEAVRWVGDRTLPQAWDECRSGDHMLWILRRMAGAPGWPKLETVIWVCCDCAELVRDRWRGDAPAKCIETLRSWCKGEATIGEVIAAADAVRANRWSSYVDAIVANDGATDAVAANSSVAAAEAAYAASVKTIIVDSIEGAVERWAARALFSGQQDAIDAARRWYLVRYACACASAVTAGFSLSQLEKCADIVRATVPTLPQV